MTRDEMMCRCYTSWAHENGLCRCGSVLKAWNSLRVLLAKIGGDPGPSSTPRDERE
jgi:hypothetical protein